MNHMAISLYPHGHNKHVTHSIFTIFYHVTKYVRVILSAMANVPAETRRSCTAATTSRLSSTVPASRVSS